MPANARFCGRLFLAFAALAFAALAFGALRGRCLAGAGGYVLDRLSPDSVRLRGPVSS